MPYIPQDRRIPADKRGYEAQTAGELNYAITRLCDLFLADHGPDYTNINAVVGALECAKQEFYRRVAAPYEDSKRVTNGDVYTATELKGYMDCDGDAWYPDENGNGWRCWFTRSNGSRFAGTDEFYRHTTLPKVVEAHGPLTPLYE